MSRRLAIFCLLVTGLLGGCSFHRDTPATLGVDLPERFVEGAAEQAAEVTPGRWWEQFGDASLEDLMVELFARNLVLEQAYARLDQARATVRVVRSARFPAVGVSAESGRSMQPSYTDDFTGDSSQLAVAATFEIDLWGKLAARNLAAGKSAEASYEELRTLYLSLAAQLADLYYLAVEQRAQLELTDATISSFTETVERVDARYRRGLVPALDLYQARQNLAAAQAARHTFESNLAAAEHAIAVLIGRYPQRQDAGELAQLPTVAESFPTGIPATLVARRPDLQAALRRIEAADASVAAAVADRFPSVNLLGSYGTSRQELTTGLLEGDFWRLLGTLTMPLFDAGRRSAEVERSRAVVREAVAAYRQAALTAFREVEDALAASRATELRLVRLEETAEATAAALRLALQRYLFGVSDYLPVLTAQRSDFETQSRLLTARRQQLSNRISLARALGGDWMAGDIAQRLYAGPGESPP